MGPGASRPRPGELGVAGSRCPGLRWQLRALPAREWQQSTPRQEGTSHIWCADSGRCREVTHASLGWTMVAWVSGPPRGSRWEFWILNPTTELRVSFLIGEVWEEGTSGGTQKPGLVSGMSEGLSGSFVGAVEGEEPPRGRQGLARTSQETAGCLSWVLAPSGASEWAPRGLSLRTGAKGPVPTGPQMCT